MDSITVIYTASILGLFSTILTDLLKIFLKPSASDNQKKALAFLSSFLVTLIYYFASGNQLRWLTIYELCGLTISVFVSSYVLYKSVVQSLELPERVKMLNSKSYGHKNTRKQRSRSNKAQKN